MISYFNFLQYEETTIRAKHLYESPQCKVIRVDEEYQLLGISKEPVDINGNNNVNVSAWNNEEKKEVEGELGDELEDNSIPDWLR